MSDAQVMAKPYSDYERKIQRESAAWVRDHPDRGFSTPPQAMATRIERFLATLRQLEAGLVAVTAERNAYRRVVDAYRLGRPIHDAIQRHRFYAECHEQRHEIEMQKQDIEIADALAGLPQLSGNSGGVAAAAGILADTWDGEPPEIVEMLVVEEHDMEVPTVDPNDELIVDFVAE